MIILDRFLMDSKTRSVLCVGVAAHKEHFRRPERTYARKSHADAGHASETGFHLAKHAEYKCRLSGTTCNCICASFVMINTNCKSQEKRKRNTERTARVAVVGLFARIRFSAPLNAENQLLRSLLCLPVHVAVKARLEATANRKNTDECFVAENAKRLTGRNQSLAVLRNRDPSRPKVVGTRQNANNVKIPLLVLNGGRSANQSCSGWFFRLRLLAGIVGAIPQVLFSASVMNQYSS